jgi:hypothetical protein
MEEIRKKENSWQETEEESLWKERLDLNVCYFMTLSFVEIV